ncbi:MAG: hypothetical protein AB1480_08620 [Nitrospirota bacterium]
MKTKTSLYKIKIEILNFLNNYAKPVLLKEIEDNIFLKYKISKNDGISVIKDLVSNKFVNMGKDDNNLKLTSSGRAFLNKAFESARKTRLEILHNIDDLSKLTTESFIGEVEEAFPEKLDSESVQGLVRSLIEKELKKAKKRVLKELQKNI